MQVPEARENKLQDIGTRLKVACFPSASLHRPGDLIVPSKDLGAVLSRFSNPFYVHHLCQKSPPILRVCRNHNSYHPDSAYLGHFPSSHRHHTCFPRVSPGLPPQGRHLGGSRDQRVGGDPERQGREMVRSHTFRVPPGPALTSQKPRSPSGL